MAERPEPEDDERDDATLTDAQKERVKRLAERLKARGMSDDMAFAVATNQVLGRS